MNILGISGGVSIGNQDGAAALLIDGELVAAAEEERFVREKFANGRLPLRAIAFCLRRAGLAVADLDAVVFPGATYDGIGPRLRRFFGFHFGVEPPVVVVDHHTAHAASAYHASGLDEALVITADGSGDGRSTTVQVGRGGALELLDEYRKPDSLGLFYAAVTQFLGFQKDSDEYKVMGMAAYGSPRYDLAHVLEITARGYALHAGFLSGVAPDTPARSKQEPLFEVFPLPLPPRVPGTPLGREHFDVAASAQRQLTQAMQRLVDTYIGEVASRAVCLAGGVALNCLMNQAIRESGRVAQLYVPPVSSDAGLALGGAYWYGQQRGERPRSLAHAYQGPGYGGDDVRDVLRRSGVAFRMVGDPVEAAAERLCAGQVVGWFQGRMEYGPRALGHRSILALPGSDVRDRINGLVKRREGFRPLAPAVPHELGGRYFEGYRDSPCMTQTFTAARRTRCEAPAVVHADGTSRLQSVHRDTCELFHELLVRVGARTGTPLLVNTSLNTDGDPLACSPEHALRTYSASGLDALVIGDCVLDKRGGL